MDLWLTCALLIFERVGDANIENASVDMESFAR